MEKQKVYSKVTILNNYNRLPPTPNFNRITMEKFGVYSEASLAPVGLKVAEFNKDMLFVDKFRKYKPEHKKSQPAEDKKDVSAKEVKQAKMPIFSFITNFLKLDTKTASWSYSLDGKAIKGPINAEEMDRQWKEDLLPFDKTLIHSNEISFDNPKTSTYTKKEASIDQFVPINLLTDPEIFNKIRLQEESAPVEPVKAEAAPIVVAKPEKKKEAKKEAKKGGKKKLTKEEKSQQQEKMKADGFTVVGAKKGTTHQVEEEESDEESDEEPDTRSPYTKPTDAKPVVVPVVENKPVAAAGLEEDKESSEEDDFEYMPSKSQTKKGKKKGGKAPSFKPEIYTTTSSVVPTATKKDTSKKTETGERSPGAKTEQKKVEQKKEEKKGPQKSSKKKKGKKAEVDPSILGFNVEPPKPKLQEPEGWGETAAKPAEIVPLSEIMKEEEMRKQKK